MTSLFIQEGMHASPRGASLGLLPLTLGIIASTFAAMGGLVARLGRTLIYIGLGVVLAGSGWLLALIVRSGTDLSLWSLAPALFAIGLGMGCCFSAIFDVALGDITPDEAGSASGSISSIQQLASGIGSAAITSIFFNTMATGLDHAMTTSLIVLGLVAASVPVVALMPPKAPEESHH